MPVQPNRRTLILGAASTAVGLGWQAGLAAKSRDSLWSSWRGPNRDGWCSGSTWPSSLAGLSKSWTQSFSDSYSGPIVSNNKVFTTETVEKRDETLIALDRATGEIAWRQQWEGAMEVPFFAKSNGDWIRSTPATDGDCVVVGGMRDVVACFDAQSGVERWRTDFVADEGSKLPPFGLVCSPLIDGEHLYIQGGGALRKMRLSDGESVWEVLPDDEGMSGGAFSSPIISVIHGVRQLVVQTRTTFAGVALDSGKVLWQTKIASFRGMNILTPIVWKDQVFTSSYGGRAQLFSLTPNDSQWDVRPVWESKAEAYMSTPLVVGDHLYMHLKNKRFSCIDLSSGEETWRTTPFGQYWSMVTDGRHILALDQVGELLLIDVNPAEFSLLERRVVSQEPSWAHLAVVDDQVFIRRQRGLDAYTWS